jgi:hypothetical protein
MNITGRLLNRVALFADIRLLNPDGLSLRPVHQGLIERYRFKVFPVNPGDFDFTNGIRYADGEFVYEDRAIAVSLTIYNNGWLVESSLSTEAAESFWEDIADWVPNLGLRSAGQLVTKKAYESQLIVHVNLDIATPFEKLQPLAQLIGQLSENPKEQLSGFYIGTEGQQLSTFTFERLVGTPFSQNEYFSRALLPTSKHIRALEEIEKIFA